MLIEDGISNSVTDEQFSKAQSLIQFIEESWANETEINDEQF